MYSVFSGTRLIATGVDTLEAMDYVWDTELNTEEHLIHIYDEETGKEIEW